MDPSAPETAMRRGVLAAAAVFVVLACLHMVALAPFAPTDESANVGYALSLMRGELPTIDTPIPTAEVPELARRIEREGPLAHGYRGEIWTANHPPLTMAVIAAGFACLRAVDALGVAIWFARGFGIACAVVTLLATSRLARALVPRSREVAVVSTAWLALVPLFVVCSGVVLTDHLATAMSTLVLAIAVEVAREGADRTRIAWLAGLCAAAATCRLSGLVITGVAVVAVVSAPAAPAAPGRPRRSGAARRLGCAVSVVASTVLVAGPFYLRNALLYGEPSGTSALLDKLAREPGLPWWWLLVRPDWWLGQVQQLLGTSVRSDELWETTLRMPPLVVLLATVVLFGLPVLGLLVASVRSRSRPAEPSSRLAWGLALAVPLGLIVMTALHESRGGLPHARYLFAGLPVIAVAFAVGLCSLPLWLALVTPVAALGLIVGFNWPGFLWAHYGATTRPTGFSPLALELDPPLAGGLAVLVPFVLVLALALVAVIASLIGLRRSERRQRSGAQVASSSDAIPKTEPRS